jgi:hypothetical protein
MAAPIEIFLDDVVQMRKPHPCGGDTWRVVRLGAEIGIRCMTCNRRVLLPRSEFERRIKRFIERGPAAENQESATPQLPEEE